MYFIELTLLEKTSMEPYSSIYINPEYIQHYYDYNGDYTLITMNGGTTISIRETPVTITSLIEELK